MGMSHSLFRKKVYVYIKLLTGKESGHGHRSNFQSRSTRLQTLRFVWSNQTGNQHVRRKLQMTEGKAQFTPCGVLQCPQLSVWKVPLYVINCSAVRLVCLEYLSDFDCSCFCCSLLCSSVCFLPLCNTTSKTWRR